MSVFVRVALSLSLLLAAVAALVTTSAQTETGAQIDARISARNTDDGQVEFALQLQVAPDEWGERILPRRRFFPAQIDHDRWLNSSTLGLDEQELVVRIIARQVNATRVEFGLQWIRTTEHGWGERILPDRRFFPRDIDHTRWLNSSTVTIGEYYTTDLDDLPISAPERVESGGDESGEAPAYVRYKFLGGENYGIQYRDGQHLTMSVPEGEGFYREYREFEGRDPLVGLVMIFPSGLELEMHPDLIDGVLARTDITDPLAVAILDSLRRSVQELEYSHTPISRQEPGTSVCPIITAPFPTSAQEFLQSHCMVAVGDGPLTLQYREYQLTLTLPPSSSQQWLILAVSNVEALMHQLILVNGDYPMQGLTLNWKTGVEVERVVNEGDTADELNALFDAIAASVTQ